MTWAGIVAANLTTTGVGLLIVVVSLNRLLGMLWPFALAVPLIPIFLSAGLLRLSRRGLPMELPTHWRGDLHPEEGRYVSQGCRPIARGKLATLLN